MEAVKEIEYASRELDALKKRLEKRRESYDWNGQRIVDDILISVDQCIESIRVLEETAKERYPFR